MYSLVYWADLQHFKWKDDFLLFFSCWHQQIQSVHLVTWHCCRQSNAEKSPKRLWHSDQQLRNKEVGSELQDGASHSRSPQEKPPATPRQGRPTGKWGFYPLLQLCGLAPSDRLVSDQAAWACLILCQNTVLRDYFLSETQSLILLSGHGKEEINHTPIGLIILWDHVRTPCSYQVYPWIPFPPSPHVRKLDKKTLMCCYLDLQTPMDTFPHPNLKG